MTKPERTRDVRTLHVGDRVGWDSSHWGLGKYFGEVIAKTDSDDWWEATITVEWQDRPNGNPIMTAFRSNAHRPFWVVGRAS